MEPLAKRLLSTARAIPDAVAIVDGGRVLTYGELAGAVLRFAGWLQERFPAGERVAIVLPNCIEAVVAWYGSWLAGCIAVPLNAQAKSRELGAWLGHATPKCVVYKSGSTEVEAALPALSVLWARQPERIVVGAGAVPAGCTGWQDMMDASRPADPLLVSGRASELLATILYTSGTTGAPKGVTLTQANFVANVGAIVAYLELTRRDSVVSALPFYYSYGASVLHTHLAVGGKLVLEPNFVFPQLVTAAIERERVTGFSGVPSTFSMLLDRVTLADYDLSSLRYLTQAGGAMRPAAIARLRAVLPQARLFVMYGQTEATARLAWLPPERLDDKPGSAGKAIRGVRIEVRDETGRALAPGTPGEVWASGRNVMAGYWNDPVATASVLHEGWLRTGDMGQMDAEGYLYLSGRRSDMIKTGAHRVHPLDVEEVLCEVPGVSDAAAVGIDDDELGQVIKAFVVVDGSTRVSANAVRAHCRVRLAGHKVPRQIEFVSGLPRTASGKVRRALLAQPVTQPEAIEAIKELP